VRSAVLGPQQHQRHALAAQLDVHVGVVGFDEIAAVGAAPEQPALECGFVEFGDDPPVQPCGAGQAEVLGHDAFGDAQAERYCRVRQAAVVLQSQDVLDHAYVHALLRHRLSGQKARRLGHSGGSHATPDADP
jgi:hypothetical protein